MFIYCRMIWTVWDLNVKVVCPLSSQDLGGAPGSGPVGAGAAAARWPLAVLHSRELHLPVRPLQTQTHKIDVTSSASEFILRFIPHTTIRQSRAAVVDIDSLLLSLAGVLWICRSHFTVCSFVAPGTSHCGTSSFLNASHCFSHSVMHYETEQGVNQFSEVSSVHDVFRISLIQRLA